MSAPGFRKCSFVCPLDREEAARLVLMRYGAIEPGSVRYENGAVRWLLDLSRVPNGDAPAMEAMLQREIERHAMGSP